jgi:hypothetical protein
MTWGGSLDRDVMPARLEILHFVQNDMGWTSLDRELHWSCLSLSLYVATHCDLAGGKQFIDVLLVEQIQRHAGLQQHDLQEESQP